MDIRWRLENIYKGCGDRQLAEDIEKYSEGIKKLDTYAREKFSSQYEPTEVIKGYIKLLNETILLEKPGLYLGLVLAADSENAEAQKLMDRFSDISASAACREALFDEYMKGISLEELSDDDIIKEHMHFLATAKRDGAYTLDPKAEEIIAKMKITGSESFKRLWENLTSHLMCELDGEEIPLSSVRGLARSPKPETRRKAYISELDAYKKIDSAGAACLNSIKGEVIKECEMRGYDSPLGQSLLCAGIDRDILNAMLSAIDESLPQLNKFYRIKAKYLGYEKLPFYELFAPVGKNELTFSFDEAKDFVIKAFGGFSEKMESFAKKTFENGWIDVSPRAGKVGGAFCENIPSMGESRILMNFGESFDDIITLSHELGHGYHNEVLKGQSAINSDYPMTLAETASTFGENLAYKAAEKILPKEALITIRENRLSEELQSIVDIYSRFLFEDSFFEKRKDGSLSPKEICSLMTEAQKKAYKDGLDENCLHPYMWLCKPHYYDADFNYYNYPYAFGDLFARSLSALYEERGAAFINEYDRLLISAGSSSVRETGLLAGIDFGDKAFWKKGIEEILKDIDELDALMKNQ